MVSKLTGFEKNQRLNLRDPIPRCWIGIQFQYVHLLKLIQRIAGNPAGGLVRVDNYAVKGRAIQEIHSSFPSKKSPARITSIGIIRTAGDCMPPAPQAKPRMTICPEYKKNMAARRIGNSITFPEVSPPLPPIVKRNFPPVFPRGSSIY